MPQEKKSFILYHDYRQHLALLSDEECGRLFIALFDYAETKCVPELSGAVLMAFSFIKAQMDRDDARYEEKVEKRRNAGRQGGRPPKQTETPESTEKQEKAKKANGFSGKQTKAKKPDNVNDNDNDNVTDIDLPPTPSIGGTTPAEGPIPYAKILELYNSICTSFPKIKVIDGQRRKAVAARWRTYKSIGAFEHLFRLTEASDFLKGQNDRDWCANFDWLVRPTNMAKVLEGRYNNETKKGGGRGGVSSGYSERQGANDQQAAEAGAPRLSGFQIVGDDGDG